jgi:mRNA-degrading endonuclease RelE of RelBE toxin-antitoxin system
METRVKIRWTKTSVNCLKRLPKKVREGIVAKADELQKSDPRESHKPLKGPLQGFRSMKYSRYRAVFKISEESMASGDVLLKLEVCFVLVGIRKEGDKHDVYKLAQKIHKLGLLDV